MSEPIDISPRGDVRRALQKALADLDAGTYDGALIILHDEKSAKWQLAWRGRIRMLTAIGLLELAKDDVRRLAGESLRYEDEPKS